MIASKITLPVKEEGTDVDGAKGVEGVADPDRLQHSYASLRLTITASMAHTLSLHDALPILIHSLLRCIR